MKKGVLLFTFALFLSCNQKEIDIDYDKTGKINSLFVIIDDQYWHGDIGDSIRKKFASPVDGLNKEEPLFTITQYSTKLLDGFVSNSRNILLVQKNKNKKFDILENEYTEPQNLVMISGRNQKEVLEVLEEQSDSIIKTLKESEIKEIQRRYSHELADDSHLQKKFKIGLRIPTSYKTAIEKDKFIWFKRDFPTGNANIVIYQVPFRAIEKHTTIIENIIDRRDSIGRKYIRGKQRYSYMMTEDSFAPFFFSKIVAGNRAYETKGTWVMRNDYMTGSYINYAIKDTKNKRFLIIEGFCYNPSTPKRDLMLEVEAIMNTIQFIN
jgi:hypothetical protein